jgi:cell division protein YceG involved in septum cleavage
MVNEYIEIPKRSTPESIANKLVSEGIIRRKWPFLLYIKLTGSAKLIKAGEYRFPSPITPLGALKKLEEGEQRLSRFTVIEGWTRWDIADAIAHIPELNLTDKDEALKLMNDTSAIRDLDPQARTQKVICLVTYSHPPDTKAAADYGMVKRFRRNGSGARGTRRAGNVAEIS